MFDYSATEEANLRLALIEANNDVDRIGEDNAILLAALKGLVREIEAIVEDGTLCPESVESNEGMKAARAALAGREDNRCSVETSSTTTTSRAVFSRMMSNS
jgi:hypothetical protein